MKANDPYIASVANKVAMIYGEVTYANVVALLTSTGDTATPHPDGMTIQRFAALVVAFAQN